MMAAKSTAQIAPDAPSDLWVATDVGLYLFREETLTEVRIGGQSLPDVRLAPRGALSLWVATPSRLLELRVDPARSTFSATELARPAGASDVAVDANGTLWLVSDRALVSLRSDLRLDTYDLPFTPARLLGG